MGNTFHGYKRICNHAYEPHCSWNLPHNVCFNKIFSNNEPIFK